MKKIAVNLWKQRRLIQAESAEIRLRNLPSWIVSAVDSKFGRPLQSVTAEELEGLDQEYFTWCETVSTEIKKIRASNITLWTDLHPVAPTILEELQNDADEDEYGTNINEYLN